MATTQQTDEAKAEARLAIFEGIAEAAKELKRHNGPQQAEGLKNLAEAYAWMSNTAQSH